MHSEENLAVLLFYAIKPLDAADEHTWQRSLCMRLSLGGRLRVAPAGLNGTLSGRRAAPDEYTSAVEQRHDGVSIDWKWGDCARSELFEAPAVRRVEELVSLGVPASSAPLTEAGEHLSPREFHAMLNGGAADAERPPILIDMRNAYEHALGHFQARDAEKARCAAKWAAARTCTWAGAVPRNRRGTPPPLRRGTPRGLTLQEARRLSPWQ